MAKIGSRIGHKRLIFSPYNSENLQQIISNRLKDVKVFSPDAIKYVSKKIAAYSSDVRKSLHICRLAIELSFNESNSNQLIGTQTINRAFQNYYSNVYLSFIESKSLPMKVILASLILLFKKNSLKTINIFTLYSKYKNLAGITGTQAYTYKQFFGMVKHLEDAGIVELKMQMGSHAEVSMAVSTDQIQFALKEEKKITKSIDLDT
jgi:Cdc6-like AAA superfamily ATPase